MNDGTAHAFGILMRAETRAADAAERRIEFAHLELSERADRRRVGDVESQNASMRAPAPRLFFIGVLGLILLVDDNRDAAPVDAFRHRHDGVRRLGEQRMVVVAAEAFGFCKIGYIDHKETPVPAARPHLVAATQRMVKTMLPPRPAWLFAARNMLARDP